VVARAVAARARARDDQRGRDEQLHAVKLQSAWARLISGGDVILPSASHSVT
jgi:hypothetical protein